MKEVRVGLLKMTAAALLVSGAALCAPAQRPAGVKQNSRAPEGLPSSGQNDQVRRAAPVPGDNAVAIHYTYEFTKDEFYNRHILIEHDGSGHGRLTFERRGNSDSIVEPLELSPAALSRISGLWQALRFLDSETKYQSERQYPQLGSMRLKMSDGAKDRVAEFNWTNDRTASALVGEYRKVGDQAMFVFDISVACENQPLDAPNLMDYLESLFVRSGLSDPKQLAPLLRDLAIDERIPLIARNHADRLLKKIEK